jgi:tRNA (adenine37-N6)-methyltransferase
VAGKHGTNLQPLELNPIGVIHTPWTETQGMPIQPTGAVGIKGTIEVFDAYREGLTDLDGFSHIILLYHFHHSHSYKLSVVPFMDTQPRGLFATRAPNRPNPIGFSIVRLDKVVDGVINVSNVDMLDGTPLLDIKPYVPVFDQQSDVRSGWVQDARKCVEQHTADDRFKK